MNVDPPANQVSLEAVQALRLDIADLYQVFDTTLDDPEPGYVRFRGQFLQDPTDCFDELRERFERRGFTPMIRNQNDRPILVALPAVFRPRQSKPTINIILLVATILSTLFVGASYTASTSSDLLMLWRGWPFSLSIMLILGAHELGHYFAARYHKVPVSLPYFIPLPLPGSIGTLGAFIQIKAPVKNKRALLDVGAAGPWAGILFAIPILFYGLATSQVMPLPANAPYMAEGNSILYALMKFIVFGQVLPADGLDVHLNQVAWAGWVGLLVTSLNLIPVGQLDGGHVAYVLFGQWAKRLFWPIIIILSALVILTGTLTWILWIALLLLFGRRYAVPLDDVTSLDPRRKAIAIITLLLFFLVFIPLPLQVVTP
jgi:membrane-associated protease RseP (regulator of RpoE activity)